MIDISANLAGIKSPNPFWLASAPPTNSGYQIMRAFEAGWGGAVWKTLGVPVVNVSSRYGALNYRDTRMMGFNNIELITDRPLVDNLREMEEVKKYFPDHAIIASLMVDTREEWHQIVKDVQNAGADGIELNFGCPHGMCERGMGSAVGQNPNTLATITSWVMEVAKVPVIVKLTPNITDVTEPARAARTGGGNAISLINTIQSVVNIDLDTFCPTPSVGNQSTNGGYCGPAVKPIALNMVKNCALDPNIRLPISGIGGVESWKDAVEFMLLGASNVQVCTAVMHYGFGIVREMESGLRQFMADKGFNKLDDFIGLSLDKMKEWKDLNLEYKVKAEINTDKCVGCQLCYIACEDGAHQAIKLEKGTRVPAIIDDNCVGCNLCSLVCPVDDCITMVQTDNGTQFKSWQDKMDENSVPTTFNDQRGGGVGHYVPKVSDALKK
ncbi:MAG: Dihydropyrimidine dehydrogenase [NADP+] (EC [uncultured Aureispira sp.]|jgi:dihydropyrimidine dehydrogenase (NAD+) subunit PreA|uniref:dihydrouracil dehydrogenase (NAD(+)) n=1 Tax=uncultured Aureispira sp. TaxID=1331704 RepID=A0A6S6S0H7_9BACT|nr:MAG: Dihydropyrimidine dehydrogenase [NADP+] (EC [uncultured Aureispira sp.]